MREQELPDFKIVDRLGGEADVINVLARVTGHKIQRLTLSKWRSRGFIPACQAVVLMDECTRLKLRATYTDDCILPHAPAYLRRWHEKPRRNASRLENGRSSEGPRRPGLGHSAQPL